MPPAPLCNHACPPPQLRIPLPTTHSPRQPRINITFPQLRLRAVNITSFPAPSIVPFSFSVHKPDLLFSHIFFVIPVNQTFISGISIGSTLNPYSYGESDQHLWMRPHYVLKYADLIQSLDLNFEMFSFTWRLVLRIEILPFIFEHFSLTCQSYDCALIDKTKKWETKTDESWSPTSQKGPRDQASETPMKMIVNWW